MTPSRDYLSALPRRRFALSSLTITARHLLGLLFVVATYALPNAYADDLIRTLAVTGQQAAGFAPGVEFTQLFSPSLNARGQAVIVALISGPSITNDNNVGLWQASSGQIGLDLVLQQGESLGLERAVSIGTWPAINEAGDVAFGATVVGGGFTGRAILGGSADAGVEVVLREDAESVGVSAGVRYDGIGLPFDFRGGLSNAGETAFYGILDTTFFNAGVWVVDLEGDQRRIARTSNLAPGPFPGMLFDQIVSTPIMNAASQVAFRATTSNPDRVGIWSEGGGAGLEAVAITGTQAPGLPSGTNFFSLGDPEIGDGGHVAFAASVQNAGVFSEQQLWVGPTAGSLELVGEILDQAPEALPGVSMVGGFQDLVVGGDGRVAFATSLIGTNVSSLSNGGIYKTNSQGELALVARKGASAPGLPFGTPFAFNTGVSDFDRPVLSANDSGQLAFVSEFGNSSTEQGTGIWAETRDGDLTLVVKTGDIIDVNDDPLIEELRQISGLEITPGSRDDWFNNLGQVAFLAQFTDGSSGIFVSDLIAIPEPSSIGLLSILVGAATLSMRR